MINNNKNLEVRILSELLTAHSFVIEKLEQLTAIGRYKLMRILLTGKDELTEKEFGLLFNLYRKKEVEREAQGISRNKLEPQESSYALRQLRQKYIYA